MTKKSEKKDDLYIEGKDEKQIEYEQKLEKSVKTKNDLEHKIVVDLDEFNCDFCGLQLSNLEVAFDVSITICDDYVSVDFSTEVTCPRCDKSTKFVREQDVFPQLLKVQKIGEKGINGLILLNTS
jgi:hypothetical protein